LSHPIYNLQSAICNELVSRVYRYCIKSRYPASTAKWCNTAIEAVANRGDTQQQAIKEKPGMITKQAKQARHNDRIDGAMGRWMTVGVSMAVLAVLLVVVVLATNRAGAEQVSFSLSRSDRSQLASFADSIGLGRLFPNESMHGIPLGIDAWQGVDLRDLPTGLTDYFRPGSITPVTHTQPAPLGIDAWPGVDPRDLPTGLTDYFRPSSITPVARTQPVQLGIDAWPGVDPRDLPTGLTDYFRHDN
jgi:hypothetical protein